MQGVEVDGMMSQINTKIADSQVEECLPPIHATFG